MEILLIRHGQSEADILHVHEGRADYPLTDLGREQAKRLACRLNEHCPPDIIWTSTLKRASETATILAEEVGCMLMKEPNLMEFNNGVLAGLPREVAATKYPLPPGGRKPHERIQNGESEIEFRMRVEMALSKILAESSAVVRIAIVSHGGTISNLLRAILQLPVPTDVKFATGDTGMHIVRKNDNGLQIISLNNTEHLYNQ
ncbi:histidine phosphatase family protein [Sutcliffiella horikoshii]|uniref:histidine phosphatase family protein n=1 Tax=Sutcliffiella horikoshii TaxID=79883 RepID=UPI001F416ED1|nr:histidine phosphatase family protein [Sutcliffiella horikoshii]MCG1021807.1 histidine phosphatase family protein [Sutcliffiella horikoshii]